MVCVCFSGHRRSTPSSSTPDAQLLASGRRELLLWSAVTQEYRPPRQDAKTEVSDGRTKKGTEKRRDKWKHIASGAKRVRLCNSPLSTERPTTADGVRGRELENKILAVQSPRDQLRARQDELGDQHLNSLQESV